MALYKGINSNLERVEADNRKIDAQINFHNFCVQHFKTMANKIDKNLVKANKVSKTYIDIADAVKLEILILDEVFQQQIGILSNLPNC